MNSTNKLLDSLNEEQKEAVLNTEGPSLVAAGAGSGKTRVLTTRLAYIINEKKAWPNQILCVTFTNKATKEMQDRVLRFIGAWLARHVTNDMKYKLYVRGIDKTDAPFKHTVGKRDIAGTIILSIWQPFLTGVGKVLKLFSKNKGKKNENK